MVEREQKLVRRKKTLSRTCSLKRLTENNCVEVIEGRLSTLMIKGSVAEKTAASEQEEEDILKDLVLENVDNEL